MAKPNPMTAYSSPAAAKRVAPTGAAEPTGTPHTPGPSTSTPAAAKRAPSRAGRHMVGGYVDAATHKQLRQLALDTDKSVQQLVLEGLNYVFAAAGKPQIALLTTEGQT
jgi:hypothetical protein